MPLMLNSSRKYNQLKGEYVNHNVKLELPVLSNPYKCVIKDKFISSSMENFYKKHNFLASQHHDVDMDGNELKQEFIDNYDATLKFISNLVDEVTSHKQLISTIIDTEKPRYLLVSRNVELALKFYLIQSLYSPEFDDNCKYDYYIKQMMSVFWNSFVELKQFSRIARKFVQIVEKEGGRDFLSQTICTKFGHEVEK